MRIGLNRFAPRGLAIGLVGLALLLAAGCGQSDSGSTATPSDSPTASSENAPSGGSDSAVAEQDKSAPLPDMTLGDPKAPIKIIEYASMTCPHCAYFDSAIFPQLKANYIDTGKVFYTFREYPLDGIALRASMVARCVGPDRFFSFVHGLFHTQIVWANPETWNNQDLTVEQKFNALADIAKEQAGMSREDFDACIKNESLMQQVTEQAKRGQDEYKVSGTPAVYINGDSFAEIGSYESLDARLKELLGEK